MKKGNSDVYPLGNYILVEKQASCFPKIENGVDVSVITVKVIRTNSTCKCCTANDTLLVKANVGDQVIHTDHFLWLIDERDIMAKIQ